MHEPPKPRAPIRRLILEVHRRSLWQVLAIYAVASWVAYQVVLGLTEGVGLPLWVLAFAIALFVIGLPIVLATAFVQEGGPARADAAGAEEATARPAPTADAPDAERASTPAGPRRHLTWPRVSAAGVGAFALFALVVSGFMGMRVLGIGPAGTLVAKGELDAREPLVVADFDGLTGDSSLAAVVAEGLRADLAQSTYITAADRERVRETLRLMLRPADTRLDAGTAREVAVRLGLKAVVEGEVGRAGSGYLLTARVVSADSGRTLAAFREVAADSTVLLPAIEALSRALRERVGESLREVRASAPLAQVTTSSLPALRRAAVAWQEEERSNRSRAIRLMREAVELDPGFSSAWAGLAVMHYNNGERDAALSAIRSALAHEDRLDDRSRHRTRGLYASIVGDHRAAAAEFGEEAALDPRAPTPHVLLSDAAWNAGDWASAEAEARTALDLGATTWVARWNLVVALLDGGRIADAKSAAAASVAALAPGADIARQLVDMGLAAESRYDSIHALNGDRPYRAALADRVLGRWDEAERHFQAMGDPQQGAGWHAVDRLVVLDDARAGDRLEVVLDSAAAADAAVPERRIIELSLALAVAGRADAARRGRELYLRRVPEEVRWSDAFLLHSVDAFLALHEGRGDAAIAALRRARASTPWTAPVDALLGRAYETLDRPDSAIAAYNRYLDTPWSYRIGFFNALSDPLLLVPVHERLAYLYERAREPAAAARHASAVVQLWADADPALQGHVAAMRRVLQRAAAEHPL